MSSMLRTASWVLLVIVGGLILLGALVSMQAAYWGMFPVGGVAIEKIAGGQTEVLLGLRGARGTAAGWAAAWATLFLFVVLGPYRRGDVTTWWGILASALVLSVVVVLRLPILGLQAGTGTPLFLLVVVILALLLDVKRLVQAPAAS
jgi:hypothetical protein